MKYCGREITATMRASWIAKTWIAKTFGSTKAHRINPDTGEEDPNGITCESDRDIAAMSWVYAMHGLCSDDGDGYDRDFVNDRIWYEIATPEEQDLRARMEDANDYMLRCAR